MRVEIAILETRVLAAIQPARREMTTKLGGMMVIAVGVLKAAMRPFRRIHSVRECYTAGHTLTEHRLGRGVRRGACQFVDFAGKR